MRLAVLAASLVVACSGGVHGDARGGAPGRDQPFSGQDRAAGGREDPNATRESPDGKSGCVACDINYRCVGTVEGKPYDRIFAATSKDGSCTMSRSVLACNGYVLDRDGDIEAVWTRSGQSITLSFQDGYVVCTPTDASPPQQEDDTPQPNPRAPDAG